MARRWPSVLLSAGAVLLLASLYLPWRTQSCESLGPFGCRSIGGWDSAAALVAVLLALAAAAAAWNTALLPRLPLARLALLGAYFGLVVDVHVRSIASLLRAEGFSVHHAYGEYLGLFAVIVVLAGAIFLRRNEVVRRRAPVDLLVIGLTVALAVSSLIPWSGDFSSSILDPVRGAVVLALFAVPLESRVPTSRQRLALAAGAATFSGGAVAESTYGHPVGLWIGLAWALALAALTASQSRPFGAVNGASWREVATAAAAMLFLASLFLPWLRSCIPGSCLSIGGWGLGAVPVAAALLAVLLVAGLSESALVAAFGLMAVTLGVQVVHASSADIVSIAYGPVIGLLFAGAAIVCALRPTRARLPDFPIRLIPIVVCVAYLAFVVLPWWYVLPTRSTFVFAPFSWLTVAGALLAIQLVWSWTRPGNAALVAVPLLLLALAVVDLIEMRSRGLTWGAGIVVALVLLLAYLGRVEQRVGLRNWRVPELLRVDRL
jgi:hypothetical protein